MLRMFAAALSGFLIAAPAFGQGQNCGPTLQVYEVLKEKHGESRHASGFSRDGMLIEMWANLDTGGWTALVTHPEGMSCVVASGEHFRREDTIDPAGMRL